MNLKDNVIVTDADGVLVNWVYSFDQWMKRHGYNKLRDNLYELTDTYGITHEESRRLTRMFNETYNIGHMPPMRDAIKYVKKLHEDHGFVFHCITSLSSEPYAAKERERNLTSLFGPTAFEKIICLDTGADKDDALVPYKDTGCFFIEDKVENAETGHRMGLQSILLEQDYNMSFKHNDIPVVKSWKEIYELITG